MDKILSGVNDDDALNEETIEIETSHSDTEEKKADDESSNALELKLRDML